MLILPSEDKLHPIFLVINWLAYYFKKTSGMLVNNSTFENNLYSSW